MTRLQAYQVWCATWAIICAVGAAVTVSWFWTLATFAFVAQYFYWRHQERSRT